MGDTQKIKNSHQGAPKGPTGSGKPLTVRSECSEQLLLNRFFVPSTPTMRNIVLPAKLKSPSGRLNLQPTCLQPRRLCQNEDDKNEDFSFILFGGLLLHFNCEVATLYASSPDLPLHCHKLAGF